MPTASTLTSTSRFHPGGGKPVDPYPYLRRAERLLFPADPGTSVSMSAEGTVSSAGGDELTLKISRLVLLPSLVRVRQARALLLSVPADAQIDTGGALATGSVADTLPTLVGQKVVVLTSPTPATLAVALGRPGAITAARIAVNP